LFQIPSHDRSYLKDYTRGEAYDEQLQIEDLQCERPPTPDPIQENGKDDYSAADQLYVKASIAEKTKKKKELQQKLQEERNEPGSSKLTGESTKPQKRPPPELVPFELPEVTLPPKKRKLGPKSAMAENALEEEMRLAVETAQNDMGIEELLASVDTLHGKVGEESIVNELLGSLPANAPVVILSDVIGDGEVTLYTQNHEDLLLTAPSAVSQEIPIARLDDESQGDQSGSGSDSSCSSSSSSGYDTPFITSDDESNGDEDSEDEIEEGKFQEGENGEEEVEKGKEGGEKGENEGEGLMKGKD
jgi:hypothetical protein